MKIVIDFDGVLTNQAAEGGLELELFHGTLLTCMPNAPATIDALFAAGDAELASNPGQHGWWHRGRLAAFADEDLFIRAMALGHCFDRWAAQGREPAATVRQAIDAAALSSFAAIVASSHEEMVRRSADEDVATVCPEARGVLEAWLARSYDVVVVSNSTTPRIMRMLEGVGLKPIAHEDNASAQFRVRGRAGKFALGEEAEVVRFGERCVDVARPSYAQVLREERPMVVVGDVFSLDIALPLTLARQQPSLYEGMHFYLRRCSYTPAWAVAQMQRQGDEPFLLDVVDEVATLPDLVRRRAQ